MASDSYGLGHARKDAEFIRGKLSKEIIKQVLTVEAGIKLDERERIFIVRLKNGATVRCYLKELDEVEPYLWLISNMSKTNGVYIFNHAHTTSD